VLSLEVASKRLQEVDGGGQAAEAIFADETPKKSQKTDRLISLRCHLGDSFWNCLEDPLEPSPESIQNDGRSVLHRAEAAAV
jgi:hypothetical protein